MYTRMRDEYVIKKLLDEVTEQWNVKDSDKSAMCALGILEGRTEHKVYMWLP